MLNWNDEQFQEQRRQDWLREAEHDRLALHVVPTRARRRKVHHSFLALLGRWLVRWGHRLQARYGAIGDPVRNGSGSEHISQMLS